MKSCYWLRIINIASNRSDFGADLTATILHCLGIDHRRLSFKFQGLDVWLTSVEEHHPVKGTLT